MLTIKISFLKNANPFTKKKENKYFFYLDGTAMTTKSTRSSFINIVSNETYIYLF